MSEKSSYSPIGVFDSGFGGLTILKEIRKVLPQYDYLFLGDNARAPYGSRSFDIVYRFTLQAVKYLFSQGCRLVILACNTASAKALRTIQQNDLPGIDPSRRVLGVIRPTVEVIGDISRTGHIGIFGTPGTIQSQSYDIEISKLHPTFATFGHACPMWVPLIENKESDGDGADYFVKKDIDALMKADANIDSVILGCTHYPLLLKKIEQYMPKQVTIVEQGPIVANSLADYLRRHPEMQCRLSQGHQCQYLTTESAEKFGDLASIFLGESITPKHIDL
ncbi:MAG: glutamate racemase [Muribaculaceae bacterium]